MAVKPKKTKINKTKVAGMLENCSARDEIDCLAVNCFAVNLKAFDEMFFKWNLRKLRLHKNISL